MDPVVGESVVHSLDHLKARRMQEVAFRVARRTLDRFFTTDEGQEPRPWLFPQLVGTVGRWLDRCLVLKDGTFPQMLLLAQWETTPPSRCTTPSPAARRPLPAHRACCPSSDPTTRSARPRSSTSTPRRPSSSPGGATSTKNLVLDRSGRRRSPRCSMASRTSSPTPRTRASACASPTH